MILRLSQCLSSRLQPMPKLCHTCGRLFCRSSWWFWVLPLFMRLGLTHSLRWVICRLCVQCLIVIQLEEKGQVGHKKIALNRLRCTLWQRYWPSLLFWVVSIFRLLPPLLLLLIQFFELSTSLCTYRILLSWGRLPGLLVWSVVVLFMVFACR